MLHECSFLWMPPDKSHLDFSSSADDQTPSKVVQYVLSYDIVPKLVRFHMESCSEKTSNCEALRCISFFLKSKHDVSCSASSHRDLLCQYSMSINCN